MLCLVASTGGALGQEELDWAVAIDPKAHALFAQAEEAMERGDLGAASSLYAEASDLDQGFHKARVSRCLVEIQIGEREPTLELCQRALELHESTEAHVAIALAFAYAGKNRVQTDTALRKALKHARAAVSSDPGDYSAHHVLCQMASRIPDLRSLERCSSQLRALKPDDPDGLVFRVYLNTLRGELRQAEKNLLRARELGMPQEAFDQHAARLSMLTPLWVKLAPTGLKIAAGWLAGFGALLGAGVLLSHATLRLVKSVAADPALGVQGEGRSLRVVYRIVLWLCCAYYYLSIPLVLVTVLLAGGGVIYGMLSTGHIPVKILLIVVLVVLGTLWAILKSILARPGGDDPGKEIVLSEHPRLEALLAEVADRVSAQPVDHVYLSPGTEVAVFEKGGMFRQIRGAARRCLILGAGVLPELKVSRLKAILAHEYGHLNNKDTAGGGFALAVRRSMVNMATGLAESGAAAWYNPAWWFVKGFCLIFMRVSHGASRLQEITADRWAVACYGPTAFIDGLRSVIEASVRFDAKASAVIVESIEGTRRLDNLYATSPQTAPSETELVDMVEEALSAQPSPYDSHPSPSQRFELARSLSAADPVIDSDGEPDAWSLLEHREALEFELTDLVKAGIVNEYGDQVLV